MLDDGWLLSDVQIRCDHTL